MTKKIEQLELKHLKLAFNEHLKRLSTSYTAKEKNAYWSHFYNELKKNCSIIET